MCDSRVTNCKSRTLYILCVHYLSAKGGAANSIAYVSLSAINSDLLFFDDIACYSLAYPSLACILGCSCQQDKTGLRSRPGRVVSDTPPRRVRHDKPDHGVSTTCHCVKQ